MIRCVSPALNLFPFRRRDDPGQQVVRENPLRPLIIPVDGEGDSLVEEGLVSLVFAAPQLVRRPDSEANCAADDIVFADDPAALNISS